MSVFPNDTNARPDNLSDDITLTDCGNCASFSVENTRQEYKRAFARAMEYACYEQLPGDVMEFGAYNGFTARIFAEAMVQYKHAGGLRLFDSFEGFPDSHEAEDRKSLKVAVQKYWVEGGMPAGQGIEQYIFDRLSPIVGKERLFIHKGFFDKTLPLVAAGKKASILHVDSDLYASAKYVLDTLEQHNCLQDGAVLLFDDWFCNRANPNFGEQAAARDFLKANRHYAFTPWFTYSWGSAAFFLHDLRVTDQTNAKTVPSY